MKMKGLLFWAVALAMVSCTGEKTETGNAEEAPKVKLTFEERVNRHVTGSLSIPATEKVDIKTYKAHLNADNSEDAIITVCRLDYAMKQTAKLPNAAQIAEFGYMGNYNYFVYYDGKLDKFSVPVPVASSARTPLSVKFDNIISETYKDLTIEYRIINSAYRNYYSLNNGVLQKIFMVKLFDHIGTDNPESVFIEYDKGSISNAKDILVYAGKIRNYSKNIDNVYTYTPDVEKTSKLLFRWFYSPSDMQYMTQNTESLSKEQ